VLRPKLLLLDEPLGALDKQLREEMQVELKSIQRESEITFIFVTHDQEEAMRMSDRIAVFNSGRVEQVGSPREVYERPQTAFVSGFLGTSNLLQPADSKKLFGATGLASLRPEHIKLVASATSISGDESAAEAVVVDAAYMGANMLYLLETVDGVRLSVTRVNEELPGETNGLAVGDRVLAKWKKSHVTSIPN
jgi:putative spermidine/putrescine transport system ATP-binding protein